MSTRACAFGLSGLGIAAVGSALAFTVAPVAGYWIAVVGVLTALCGIALHWAKNWRRILGATHE
jgi:hypothetical protein